MSTEILHYCTSSVISGLKTTIYSGIFLIDHHIFLRAFFRRDSFCITLILTRATNDFVWDKSSISLPLWRIGFHHRSRGAGWEERVPHTVQTNDPTWNRASHKQTVLLANRISHHKRIRSSLNTATTRKNKARSKTFPLPSRQGGERGGGTYTHDKSWQEQLLILEQDVDPIQQQQQRKKNKIIDLWI